MSSKDKMYHDLVGYVLSLQVDAQEESKSIKGDFWINSKVHVQEGELGEEQVVSISIHSFLPDGIFRRRGDCFVEQIKFFVDNGKVRLPLLTPPPLLLSYFCG